jgi:hypothetical protein
MIDVAAAPPPQPVVEEQSPTRLELEVAQMKQSRPKRSAADALGDEPSAHADAEAAVAAQMEDAEVICIIRPIRKPGSSKVVIINRASRKFMKYLTGETKDQLQPTISQADAPEPSTIDEPRPQPAPTTVAATTSAWKPTSLSLRFPSR